MDNQENYREHEQNVKQRGRDVENDECAYPREEQQKREGKKYKSH
jgi:hypothetical protein